MTSEAAAMTPDIANFNDTYDRTQSVHRAWLAVVWAATTILIVVFALLTSLQSLRIQPPAQLYCRSPFLSWRLKTLQRSKKSKNRCKQE